MDRFVAVDVETASRSPTSVCAIGAARIERGRETGSFASLVRFKGPVRYGHIHGLREPDLAGAPAWPNVWSSVLELLRDVRLIVAFRASFDRGAILAMCAAHGLKPPRQRFVCAATMIEQLSGGYADLEKAISMLGLSFPGRPHDALADARAAAMIAVRYGIAFPSSSARN